MTALKAKDWVYSIAPYIAGRSTGDDGRKIAKLSSNENPLGTSPLALAALRETIAESSRYPDSTAGGLCEAIGAHYGLDPARIVFGTGSDEVLRLAAGAFAGMGDEVLYVRYGFIVYDIAARRVGAVPVVAPDSGYGTDVDALLAAVTPRTRVVFVANPNNPTGTYSSRSEIARLHAGLPSDCLLVVDQAYTEYLSPEDDDGALELAKTQPNVLVTRTFSKIFGLAAERIGWGYGSAEIVAAMHRIRAAFNVTAAGQAAATAALADTAFVQQSRLHNARWLTWLTEQVGAFAEHGVRAVPSKGNFLLVLFEGEVSADMANKALMEHGFIVRGHPCAGLEHGLRISVGTETENLGLIKALSAILSRRG